MFNFIEFKVWMFLKVIIDMFYKTLKVAASFILAFSKKNSIIILCSPHCIYQHRTLQTSLL